MKIPISTEGKTVSIDDPTPVQASVTDDFPPEPPKQQLPYKFTFSSYARRSKYRTTYIPRNEMRTPVDVWYSRPFYSHRNGYKMCVGVAAQGVCISSASRSNHLAVCVCLMKGEYDNSLKWPFKGVVTIQLLNQGG